MAGGGDLFTSVYFGLSENELASGRAAYIFDGYYHGWRYANADQQGETFADDGRYEYQYAVSKTELVRVGAAGGSELDISEAINKGIVGIDDLTKYGFIFFRFDVNTGVLSYFSIDYSEDAQDDIARGIFRTVEIWSSDGRLSGYGYGNDFQNLGISLDPIRKDLDGDGSSEYITLTRFRTNFIGLPGNAMVLSFTARKTEKSDSEVVWRGTFRLTMDPGYYSVVRWLGEEGSVGFQLFYDRANGQNDDVFRLEMKGGRLTLTNASTGEEQPEWEVVRNY